MHRLWPLLLRVVVSQGGGACQGGTTIQSCGLNGRCVMLTYSSPTCLCDDGYWWPLVGADPGDACNQSLDYCAVSAAAEHELCFNGGTCVSTGEDPFYECDCYPYYGGPNCERHEDPCGSSPTPLCMNGGTCLNHPNLENGYYCDCAAGFEGEVCQYVKETGLGGAGVELSPAILSLFWALFALLGCIWLYCGCTLLMDGLVKFVKSRMKPI